jgi:hypothetical protein
MIEREREETQYYYLLHYSAYRMMKMSFEALNMLIFWCRVMVERKIMEEWRRMEDGRGKRRGRDGARKFIRGTYSMLMPTHMSIQEAAK